MGNSSKKYDPRSSFEHSVIAPETRRKVSIPVFQRPGHCIDRFARFGPVGSVRFGSGLVGFLVRSQPKLFHLHIGEPGGVISPRRGERVVKREIVTRVRC